MFVFVIVFLKFLIVQGQYEVPNATIQILSPRGFKVSIPYEDGIEIFAFHGNINKEILNYEAGTYSVDIVTPKDGKLTFWEKTAKLKPGDIIYYWTYVQFFGRGFPRLDQKFVVPGKPIICDPSGISHRPYQVPDATFEILQPRGFKVSIPYREGIEIFAFHANVNKEMHNREAGAISVDILRPADGKMTYWDRWTKLKPGDVIYYWTYVQLCGLGYPRDDQEFSVPTGTTNTNFESYPIVNNENNCDCTTTTTTTTTCVSSNQNSMDQSTIKPIQYPTTSTIRTTAITDSIDCKKTDTKINGNRNTCMGKMIFESKFSGLNLNKWRPEYRFSDKPDYEFVTYTDDSDVIFTKNNILHIKPIVAEEKYFTGYANSSHIVDLAIKCTGKSDTPECLHVPEDSLILPPILSGQITTNNFSFKYGIVEIKAKLPKGDWIYPELYLRSRNEEYGPDYDSGLMIIAFAAGNSNYNRELSGGCVMSPSPEGRRYGMNKIQSESNWSDDYHVFQLKWKPDRIILSVDNKTYANIQPPENGFASLKNQIMQPAANKWRSGSVLAPFDKEMYVTIGVGVGGHCFSDEISGKPWKNNDTNSRLQFYQAKGEWRETWNEETELLVEYVKIYAL